MLTVDSLLDELSDAVDKEPAKDATIERAEAMPEEPTSPAGTAKRSAEEDLDRLLSDDDAFDGGLDAGEFDVGSTVVTEPRRKGLSLRVEGREPVVVETDRFVLGRESTCDMQVPSKLASRKHAAVSRADGGFVLEDLDSRNGTWVRGERIEQHSLADGDVIVIGGKKILVRLHPE